MVGIVSTKNHPPTRRKVLGSIGGAIGAGTVGSFSAAASSGCGVPQDEDEFSEEDYEWRIRTSDHEEGPGHNSDYDYATELRGGFYYLGSHTNKYGKVEHFFTTGAVSTTQRKRTYRGDWAYSEYPNSAGHAIQIENRDPSTANLIAVDQPGRLGAWPPESDDDEYTWDSLAFTVVAGAIGAGSSLLGLSLSAAAAVSSMANSQRTDSGDSQHFGWTFTGSDLPCETVHYCNFTMECFKGETQATVRVDEMTGDHTEDNDIIELGFWNSVNALSTRAQNEDSVPTAGTKEFTQYCEQSPEFKKVSAEDHPWRGLVPIHKSEGPFYIAANPTVEGGLAK